MRDVLWVAGLYEGEGYLSHNVRADGWTLGVNMSDQDVIERLLGCVGLGNIRVDVPTVEHYKTMFKWTIHAREHVLSVVDDLYSHVGARRRARFDEFRAWHAIKPQPHRRPPGETLAEANARRVRAWRARQREHQSS